MLVSELLMYWSFLGGSWCQWEGPTRSTTQDSDCVSCSTFLGTQLFVISRYACKGWFDLLLQLTSSVGRVDDWAKSREYRGC
jgi:hypothetical protein